MRIHLASVYVDDQAKALRFYTEVLGFVKKTDVPLGEARWLTVVSPDEGNGTELVLEPDRHPAVKPFRDALARDGIPFTSFAVGDVRAEFERLSGLGVKFTQEPVEMGPVTAAVFDDTCGNLIQIAHRTQGRPADSQRLRGVDTDTASMRSTSASAAPMATRRPEKPPCN